MKILVTGGLGFIGSNFIRNALSKHPDKEIINIDKIGVGANPENLQSLKNEDRYHFIKADISNPQALEGILEGCSAVINFGTVLIQMIYFLGLRIAPCPRF
jgi:dTDP-glucose 4,6-dehydratase